MKTLAALLLAALPAAAQTLPPLHRQPNPMAVVREHMAAFSACDWNRLMAQFPDTVEFNGPNGQLVRGRAALGRMYTQALKPPSQGGTCGLKVTPVHIYAIGDTINVQWIANAPFLLVPYRGVDAYETHDGLMAAQVTTFDASALRIKASAKTPKTPHHP